MKIKMKVLLFFTTMLAVSQALAMERYVRPDGGTWDQCDGTTNIAYSESITDKACAVKHLFELLDPQEKEVRMSGGDTVNILNNSDGTAAEYRMGAHAGYINGDCGASWAYECVAPPIPSGTAGNPTVIRGGDSDTCETKPVLWGSGRARRVLTIDQATHVKISCLTITDKSSCIGAANFPDKSVVCDRGEPYDKLFADAGMLMRDSSEVLLQDLNVQGLGKGILAGRLHNIKLERVNLFANSSVGWDGDINWLGGDSSSNTGTIEFKDSSISFNGCGLIYNPGENDHLTPHSCAHQDFGGYGDGVGTAETAGDWIFDNVKVMHNNSDGIDLLYNTLGGTVTIKNSHVEGNGGNQIKVSGNANIENNIVVGTCGWNSRQIDKIGEHGENCRALGTAIVMSYTHADTKVRLINNTVVSEGDCIIGSGNRNGMVDSLNQSIYIVNNAFYALPDFLQSFENSCLYYTSITFPNKQIHNNLVHKPKTYDSPCNNFQSNLPTGATAGVCTTSSGPYFDNDDLTVISNPHFPDINRGVRYSAYDKDTLDLESHKPYPKDSISPLVNAGFFGQVDGIDIPGTDYYGLSRAGNPDIGAIEYRAPPKAPTIIDIKK